MGSECTTNQTDWAEDISVSSEIKASHINELRTAINDEYERRDIANTTTGTSQNVGNLIDKDDFLYVVNKIDDLTTYDWDSGIKTDSLIKAAHINEIRTNLNIEETYCVCNCDYCTCNCDYCTCNCNYCTCNCNYSCTCDCNYSDERLKTDIIYI